VSGLILAIYARGRLSRNYIRTTINRCRKAVHQGGLLLLERLTLSQHVDLTPVSNREDWDDTFELFDVSGDESTALDLSAVTAITLTLWDPECPSRALLSAEIDDGITIDDASGGIISIHFDASDMEALCAKSYAFRIGMVNGGATKDLMIGTLPIEDGGPT
jgi:hypothetical protein